MQKARRSCPDDGRSPRADEDSFDGAADAHAHAHGDSAGDVDGDVAKGGANGRAGEVLVRSQSDAHVFLPNTQLSTPVGGGQGDADGQTQTPCIEALARLPHVRFSLSKLPSFAMSAKTPDKWPAIVCE